MNTYKLEIKQIVDYPRSRMYREFVRNLISNNNIRIGNSCGLYYYVVLCCFANFRSSYKNIKGFSFNIFPGEWILPIAKLTKYLRTTSKRRTLSVMQTMQDRHLLTYEIVGRGDLVKYHMTGWARHNRVLEYNAPCQKDCGFFFVPMDKVTELVSSAKCSEMDALLDLWMNTVYNDPQVQGSDACPVVYMRNGSGNPLVSYSELAERWGISKATVGRYIKHLTDLECISCVSFSGKHGTVISLRGYLSTMFSISDVMLDTSCMKTSMTAGNRTCIGNQGETGRR